MLRQNVSYFAGVLRSEGFPTDVTRIGVREIRAFTLYLQQKRCFSNHRFSRRQERGLSGHTVNCYLRSIRAFWSWLVAEEMIGDNPFFRVKLPRPARKVVSVFSENQILRLLSVIDTSTPVGYRNYAIILTLLDTALRVSELAGITMDDLWLADGLLKVMGKGEGQG